MSGAAWRFPATISRAGPGLVLMVVVGMSAAAGQLGQPGPAGGAAGPTGQVPPRQGISAGRGGPAPAVPRPRPPAWVPLPPAHAKAVDDILQYWEQRTNKITRFRCKYKRFEYDPVFGPRDPKKFRVFARGTIQYAAPDKGLYQDEEVWLFGKTKEHPEGTYVRQPELRIGEHWVCDGKSIFQFDYAHKKLVEFQLPPEVQGTAIRHGPLPFVFGAKADDIRRRFWVRIITPPERAQGKNPEYWLEAVPKHQEDAAEYRVIHLIIDQKEFLPKAMIMFGRVNGSRKQLEFHDREVNFSVLAEKLNLFHRQFYEPKTPSGWTKDVRKVQQVAAGSNAPRR